MASGILNPAVSLLVARHILVGAHAAAHKEDELELLYDDADFL